MTGAAPRTWNQPRKVMSKKKELAGQSFGHPTLPAPSSAAAGAPVRALLAHLQHILVALENDTIFPKPIVQALNAIASILEFLIGMVDQANAPFSRSMSESTSTLTPLQLDAG